MTHDCNIAGLLNVPAHPREARQMRGPPQHPTLKIHTADPSIRLQEVIH